MRVEVETIGRGRLLHVRDGEGRLPAPWIRAFNGLFAAWMWPAFRTARVSTLELPASSNRPRVYYSWHAYSWVAHLIIAAIRSDERPAAIAHSGVASQLNQRAGAFLGSEMLVFDVDSEMSPRAQIAEAMRVHGCDVMIFADSGGPYFVLKPGMLHIAREVGAELVPFVIESRPALRFGKTMRHLVPVPLARLRMVAGPPIDSASASLDACTAALEALEASAFVRERP